MVLRGPRIGSKIAPFFFDELRRMFAAAELVAITETVAACRDPDDDKFLELAVNGRADVIVSGDADQVVLNTFRDTDHHSGGFRPHPGDVTSNDDARAGLAADPGNVPAGHHEVALAKRMHAIHAQLPSLALDRAGRTAASFATEPSRAPWAPPVAATPEW